MKQILCFGDSNTYGLIPGTTNQRYGWGTRWTSILDDKVRTKGYRVIEEGLCGRTTVFDDPFRTERRGTEMLPAILESHRPVDTIVLMLGTNDCKSVYSATPEVIGQGIEQLLDQINTVNPDAKILLGQRVPVHPCVQLRHAGAGLSPLRTAARPQMAVGARICRSALRFHHSFHHAVKAAFGV